MITIDNILRSIGEIPPNEVNNDTSNQINNDESIEKNNFEKLMDVYESKVSNKKKKMIKIICDIINEEYVEF
jgi:Ca2+-binding EF-hand superfamily protein